MHRMRSLFCAAVWRKHQEASRHQTNRTIIIDLGSRVPARLHACRLWLRNTCGKVRIKVSLQSKMQEIRGPPKWKDGTASGSVTA